MNVIIQNRRGAYANVIPQKLLPGEVVVVSEGDPASPSGQSVYIGTKTGEIQRLAFSSEVTSANIQAQEAAQQAQEAASNAGTINTQIQTKLNTVTQLAEQVATDAQTASTAAQTASDKADIAVDAQTDAETAAQTAVDVLDSMAPTYSPSATYNVGDLVIHDNQLYQCTTKISTAEAWNPNHWTESTVEDELTNLKDDLNEYFGDVVEQTIPYTEFATRYENAYPNAWIDTTRTGENIDDVIYYSATSIVENYKIPLDNVQSITYPLFRSIYNYGSVIIDEDGTIIWGYSETTAEPGTEKTISIPSSGKYFILCLPNSLPKTGLRVVLSVMSNGIPGRVSDLESELVLLSDEIPDTTQTYTFSDGSVSQVTHTRNNVAIRTDVFIYAINSITEIRTLNTGESLTIVTNLTTLETIVTYSAA